MWDCSGLPRCRHLILMGLGPSLQLTPESLLWPGGSTAVSAFSSAEAEPLDSLNIFFSCYLGFKFKCQKNTVCGAVFLWCSLVLGFAKFTAFPNISTRRYLRWVHRSSVTVAAALLALVCLMPLWDHLSCCYLPLVSVFIPPHCVLFASSPFLLFAFISSHTISWCFLDSLPMASFCLGWSQLMTCSVMPPPVQVLSEFSLLEVCKPYRPFLSCSRGLTWPWGRAVGLSSWDRPTQPGAGALPGAAKLPPQVPFSCRGGLDVIQSLANWKYLSEPACLMAWLVCGFLWCWISVLLAAVARAVWPGRLGAAGALHACAASTDSGVHDGTTQTHHELIWS